MSDDRPLIVGAGATGLSAALFLSLRGIEARVVEPRLQIAPTSRALGVNPRTLNLLEPSGVTDRILAEAQPMRAMRVHDRGQLIAEIPLDVAALGARHPMVILPQARTETLLEAALAERGVIVERGVSLGGLDRADTWPRGRTVDAEGRETAFVTPLLLGADGAHSPVRHALDIDFPGSSFPEAWFLADVVLSGPEPGVAHADFRETGPFVALPFKDSTWRLIGFGADLTQALPSGWRLEREVWRSGFHIAHRRAGSLVKGRIALAGDAAHIHSPLGARGMNLGIEDAYVFAACAADTLAGWPARLADYQRLRAPVHRQVVGDIETLTRGARATRGSAAFLRRWLLPMAAHVPALRHQILRRMTGLDHPVQTRLDEA